MQVTETLSDGLRRAWTVILPAAQIEGKRTTKLTELGRTMRLPGFRPGRVPMPVMKQRYGSAVMAEVLQESVDEATRQVLSERNLRPAMQPRVTPVSAEGAGAGDFEFKVEVELLPEIPTPDLKAIELTRLKAEVAPEVVEQTLADLARRQRTMEDVTESRTAAAGDWLKVDYKGTIDGEPFGGNESHGVDIEVAGPGMVPGFTEQLEGLSAGESRTIMVRFPDDYPAAEVAGKEASFEITAHALRRAIVPELDDALAEKLGFETLAELRETVERQTQREYDQLSRLRLKRLLLDALAERASFEVPPTMVEGEFSQIWARVEQDRAGGRLDPEDRAKDEETLRSEYHAIAERRVRLGLLLAEIGRANGINVTSEETSRALRMEAGRYPGQEAQVVEYYRKNPQMIEMLRGPIFEDKVVDYVLELARVEERTTSLEELQEELPVAL